MDSTFATWSRAAALAVLLAFASLIGYGLAAPAFPMPPVATGSDSTKSDLALYGAVLNRVQAGQGFYAATATEQRTRGYPLRPFVTVRPPWLTRFLATIGGRGPGTTVLTSLVILASVAMMIRLMATLTTRWLRIAGALAALAFLFVATVPIFWYEAWCAALVLLALAVWSDRTWGLSLALGLSAALLRELAAPFLLVMLACALLEKRWREAAAWTVALAIFAGALAHHASEVHAVATLADKASPGWVRGGGWPFILRIVHESSALIIAPDWLAAVLVPLALLGWASWRHPIAHRATLYLVGFIVTFMLVGRQNTAYWGMLLTSVLLIGVAFVPSAIRVLVSRLRAQS